MLRKSLSLGSPHVKVYLVIQVGQFRVQIVIRASLGMSYAW